MSEEVKDIQSSTEGKNETSSYRSIFKATSLFGGVQVYQIIIQIIKSKFVAVLLGPAGVGIIGLFQSGLDLIKSLTSFGLSSSAVRDVSVANSTGDKEKIARTIAVIKRLVFFTGLLGLVVTIVFSPVLSKSSFGSYSYIISFILLSVTLLLDQFSAGQKVKLQGLRRLKDLAKCSAIGVTLSLLFTVPVYYVWGERGIVPTLILNSISVLIVSTYYSNKVKIDSFSVSLKEAFSKGREMIVMGLSMSVSPIMVTIVAYCIRSHIQHVSGVEIVGLYQAGFVIMNTYVGLVFNAIATDYYPRLAAINNDNEKCRKEVSQQGEISTMILSPLLTLCMVFMPFMLRILYSDRFLLANDYIVWACLGMMFRLASWVISFLFIAKAESKLYILNEFAANGYNLLFSIVGFNLWGLKGLGIAFSLGYVIYFIQVYIIAKIKFQFSFSKDFYITFIPQLLLVCVCLLVVLFLHGWIKYTIGIVFILLSFFLGVKGLNEKINLIGFIKNRKEKRNGII